MFDVDSLNGAVARPAFGDYLICKGGKQLAEMRRIQFGEECSITENGNDISGHWALFDLNGVMVDHDQYRHDIAALYQFTIKGS